MVLDNNILLYNKLIVKQKYYMDQVNKLKFI